MAQACVPPTAIRKSQGQSQGIPFSECRDWADQLLSSRMEPSHVELSHGKLGWWIAILAIAGASRWNGPRKIESCSCVPHPLQPSERSCTQCLHPFRSPHRGSASSLDHVITPFQRTSKREKSRLSVKTKKHRASLHFQPPVFALYLKALPSFLTIESVLL